MALSNGEQELEAEYFRLGQELLTLKRLALEIGIPKLKTLDYEAFEAFCKQHKIT